MSYWAHVAAVFRVDKDGLFCKRNLPSWQEMIGKECLFDAFEPVWKDMAKHPNDYLPGGSEGTCRMSVVADDSDINHACRYTIAVQGDLRDVETPRKIEQWFKRACRNIRKQNLLSMRQAVCYISCEKDDVERVVTCRYEDMASYSGKSKLTELIDRKYGKKEACK